jgi:hypothetical protein
MPPADRVGLSGDESFAIEIQPVEFAHSKQRAEQIPRRATYRFVCERRVEPRGIHRAGQMLHVELVPELEPIAKPLEVRPPEQSAAEPKKHPPEQHGSDH